MEEEAADEAIVACLARIEAASARLLQLEGRAAALHSQPSPTSVEKTQSPSEGKVELTSGSLSAQEASSSTPPLSKRKRIPTPRKAGAAESSDLASSSSKSVGVGLKEYSLMVCEKVLARGTTTYNEVADSLVQDFMAGNVRGACDGEIDEKNIRRRVYDALNVLEACGAIAKDSKSVRWVSWPRGPPAGPAASSATGVAEQQQECADQQAAEVCERIADLKGMVAKGYCLCNLALRNMGSPPYALLPGPAEGRASSAELGLLPLPFMLIQVGRGVQSTILYGEPDRRLAHIELSSTPPGTLPYLLLDDEMVMQRMGLGTSLPDLPEEGYGRGPQRQLDQPLASPWLRGVPKAEAGDETASPQAPPLESLDLEPLAPQAVLEAPWYYARGLGERAFGHPPPGS